MSSLWSGLMAALDLAKKRAKFWHSNVSTRSGRGYTIIEVMIVLGITGVLFSSAVLMFQGQQGRTSLNQAMYDFASKLQSYVTEVNSGIYNGSQTYSCDVSSGKATLSASGGTLGSDQACVFVGRAIQLIPGSSDVYVYTVIGSRDAYDGANDTGLSAQSLEDTNPQVANVGGSMVLVDKYSFPGDLKILSAKTVSSDGTALNGYGDLVGLYEDLSGSGSGTNLETIAFPFPQGGDQNTPNSAPMANCLSLSVNCASTTNGYSGSGYRRIANWSICIREGSSAKAEVKVKTSSGGISTEVDSQTCS